MNMIEFEGKTIDDAIEKACRELGAPREKLNVEIVAEGTAGFFGLGSKPAKIKARLMTISMEDDTFGDSETISVAAAFPADDVPAAGPAPSRAAAALPPPAATVSSPAKKEGRPQKKDPLQKKDPRPASSETDLEVGEKARTILAGILERMGIDAPVVLEIREDAIALNIQGDGGGLIIGKRGQNLDALQYIVNKAANRSGEEKKMIVIDTEAYRQRREDALASLAERLGQKVKKTRKAITVSHMNAHDRRIIHLTLQGDASLVTKSRGEGEYRKIIIMPARREKDKPAAN